MVHEELNGRGFLLGLAAAGAAAAASALFCL